MAIDRESNILSWIAIGISIVSLFFSLLIYNRTSDLGEEIESIDISQNISEASEIYSNLERDVNNLLENVDENINEEELADNISNIRRNLNERVDNLSEDAREEFDEWDDDLARIENNARQNSSEAINDLQGFLERIQRDVETDEN